MKKLLLATLLVCFLLLGTVFAGCTEEKKDDDDTNDDDGNGNALPYEGKKILYVNSYHAELEWAAGITTGLEDALNGTGVTLDTVWMDTKRNPDEAFKQNAALEVKNKIDAFGPDVVIVADDNAFKYVIMDHYRDADLPFVFCGVNWDLSAYDGPYTNTAGMVEVALFEKLIEHMERYANGTRVGFMSGDMYSERIVGNKTREILGIDWEREYYAQNFTQWKDQFLTIQNEVDMLVFEGYAGIENWDHDTAKAFVEENIKIPTGATVDWMMDFSLIGLTKIAEEQGEWAANAALEIIDGKTPAQVGVVQNSEGKLILNLDLADALGIDFDPSLMRNAELIQS